MRSKNFRDADPCQSSTVHQGARSRFQASGPGSRSDRDSALLTIAGTIRVIMQDGSGTATLDTDWSTTQWKRRKPSALRTARANA